MVKIKIINKLTKYLASKGTYLVVNFIAIIVAGTVWTAFFRNTTLQIAMVWIIVGVITLVSLIFLSQSIENVRFNPLSYRAWGSAHMHPYWRPLGALIRLNLLGGCELAIVWCFLLLCTTSTSL